MSQVSEMWTLVAAEHRPLDLPATALPPRQLPTQPSSPECRPRSPTLVMSAPTGLPDTGPRPTHTVEPGPIRGGKGMSKSSLSIATMALMLAMSGSALLGGTALASAPSTAGANMSQHGIVPSACQTFNYNFVTHTFTSVPTSCTTSSTSSTNTNPGTQNNNCQTTRTCRLRAVRVRWGPPPAPPATPRPPVRGVRATDGRTTLTLHPARRPFRPAAARRTTPVGES